MIACMFLKQTCIWNKSIEEGFWLWWLIPRRGFLESNLSLTPNLSDDHRRRDQLLPLLISLVLLLSLTSEELEIWLTSFNNFDRRNSTFKFMECHKLQTSSTTALIIYDTFEHVDYFFRYSTEYWDGLLTHPHSAP